jgi:hypothetical protein
MPNARSGPRRRCAMMMLIAWAMTPRAAWAARSWPISSAWPRRWSTRLARSRRAQRTGRRSAGRARGTSWARAGSAPPSGPRPRAGTRTRYGLLRPPPAGEVAPPVLGGQVLGHDRRPGARRLQAGSPPDRVLHVVHRGGNGPCVDDSRVPAALAHGDAVRRPSGTTTTAVSARCHSACSRFLLAAA